MGKHSKPVTSFKLFRRKWQVTGNKVSQPEFFFTRKGAETYAKEMNAWTEEYFNGEKFTTGKRF